MILRRERSLKNNVYSTKTSFVNYGKKDESGAIDTNIAAEEAKIIDDFGAPKVSIGGSFLGAVKVTDKEVKDKKVKVVEVVKTTYETKQELENEPDEAGVVKIDFVLTVNEINLDETFATSLSINADSTKEIGGLTAEQVAEAKCKIFEKVIQDRAEKKILEYKEKLTDFETGFANKDNFEEFEIPVVLFIKRKDDINCNY